MSNLDDHPNESIFGTHETPFPALRQLTIAKLSETMEVYKDAFRVLASAATLRSLSISDHLWLHFLLPHIPSHLVSLQGNFSTTPMDTFLQFINTHAALKDLAILGCDLDPSGFKQILDLYATLDLGQDVLLNLWFFWGPFTLTPKFIRSRPVTTLMFGPHHPIRLPFSMLDPRVPLAFLQGLHGSKSKPMDLGYWNYLST